MEQQYNTDQNKFLATLLADPANDGYVHTSELERLVNEFPQSGILHALLARSGGEKYLKHAAVHFNPLALYKLVNMPSALDPVAEGQLILHGTNQAPGVESDAVSPEVEVITEADVEHSNYQDIGDDNAVIDSHVAESPAEELPESAPHEDIEDETYEEIVGIEEINTRIEPVMPVATGEDKLVADNIVSTDFFMFDKAFGDHQPVEEEAQPAEDTGAPETTHDISKYNDDKMPYTFMWWLDKTRREHAGTLQPYAKAPAVNTNSKKNIPNELHQQYIENIFHITPLEDLGKASIEAPADKQPKRKEQVIIERFIQEEPQIKPQSMDKLDNENKARKSAEDHDELVTETLAAIYTDQMLYHKAIASYKKLMLKFPEKSRYFADKIEQLEKRTN